MAERRSRCIFRVVHSAAADILPAGNSTSPETPCVSALKSSAADRRSRLSVFRGGLRVGGLPKPKLARLSSSLHKHGW